MSSPGGCNVYAKVKSKYTNYSSTIELNSILLMSAWEDSLLNNGPTISKLPLDKCWKWFQKLDIRYRQIAKNSTEMALFALLSLCLEENVFVTNLIWLTHIFEALYEVKGNNIKCRLAEKIFIFLDQPDYHNFKEKIIGLYNIRNKFVHGNFGIAHPSRNEILDRDYDSYVNNLINYEEFGFEIVIATFQKMITNDLKSIKI